MPKMKRPCARWSNMAACAATSVGWLCDRFDVPLPSLMVVVAAISVARKMKLLVMFSQRSVRCSPTNASWKPSRSARMTVSRSSCSVRTGSRCAGCMGIMNRPSFIQAGWYRRVRKVRHRTYNGGEKERQWAQGVVEARGAVMERRIELLAGAVKVSLENGEDPGDIVPILAAGADLACTQRLQKLLVVSGFGDPATSEAVSNAIEEMYALGVRSPFKIAFVAYTFPQYSIYHFAERYADKFGIEAKVFVAVRDAQDWLGLKLEGIRALQPQAPGARPPSRRSGGRVSRDRGDPLR